MPRQCASGVDITMNERSESLLRSRSSAMGDLAYQARADVAYEAQAAPNFGAGPTKWTCSTSRVSVERLCQSCAIEARLQQRPSEIAARRDKELLGRRSPEHSISDNCISCRLQRNCFFFVRVVTLPVPTMSLVRTSTLLRPQSILLQETDRRVPSLPQGLAVEPDESSKATSVVLVWRMIIFCELSLSSLIGLSLLMRDLVTP